MWGGCVGCEYLSERPSQQLGHLLHHERIGVDVHLSDFGVKGVYALVQEHREAPESSGGLGLCVEVLDVLLWLEPPQLSLLRHDVGDGSSRDGDVLLLLSEDLSSRGVGDQSDEHSKMHLHHPWVLWGLAGVDDLASWLEVDPALSVGSTLVGGGEVSRLDVVEHSGSLRLLGTGSLRLLRVVDERVPAAAGIYSSGAHVSKTCNKRKHVRMRV